MMKWLAKDIFLGSRVNFYDFVKFYRVDQRQHVRNPPDRHTWMLNLSLAGLAIRVRFGRQAVKFQRGKAERDFWTFYKIIQLERKQVWC